jgi:ribosomal RNA-processing protein 9
LIRFGHQSPVTSIDALSREKAITSGGMDRSIRIWKIPEESQLVFNGHHGNIECVKLINEENFISASDDGSLCLWSSMKKKPVHTVSLAHGKSSVGEPNWISAVATLLNTDLFASGSCDGHVRIWKISANSKSMNQVLELPVKGFVNALAFTGDGKKLIVGVGQEHRLGRWWTIKEATNMVLVVPFSIET